ncbi:hypothetical protein C8R43DRAFT_906209, partial [Mycena crocata]
RAEGLWFEDCGLIIRAENTLFRVSRDVLAIHSPVFRDMLALPPPPDADTMEGCPFVRLPDSAADVTVFLKTLFYYNFFEAHPASTTFSCVAGILRMSHKYEVDALRKRALTHISSLHPTTLQGWEALGEEDMEPFGDSFLHHIVLARQLSIDWILPIALYRVTKYSYESQIIGGNGGFELDREDKINCMVAGRQMETANTKILDFLWTPEVIDGCQSQRKCTSSRFAQRRRVEGWRTCSPEESPRMPLDFWKENSWKMLDVCDVCLSAMKITHQAARQAFWDGLPAMFGFQDWSVFEDTKSKAFQ